MKITLLFWVGFSLSGFSAAVPLHCRQRKAWVAVSNRGSIVNTLSAANFKASTRHIRLRIVMARHVQQKALIILLDDSALQGIFIPARPTTRQKSMDALLSSVPDIFTGERGVLVHFTTKYNLWPQELWLAEQLIKDTSGASKIIIGKFNQETWISTAQHRSQAVTILHAWRSVRPSGIPAPLNAIAGVLNRYLQHYGAPAAGLNFIIIGSGQDYGSKVNYAAVSNMLFNAQAHLYEVNWRNPWRCHGPGTACMGLLQEQKNTPSFMGRFPSGPQPEYTALPLQVGGTALQMTGMVSEYKLKSIAGGLAAMLNSGYELRIRLNHPVPGYIRWKLKLHKHDGIRISGMNVMYPKWLARCIQAQ